MSRFRITVRALGVELRGYIDNGIDEEETKLAEFAEAMKPIGLVIASPAAHDYDPFKEQDLRELHHFETEEENERLKADHTASEKALIDLVNKQRDVIERIITARSNHPECEKHPDDDAVTCGWKRAVQDIDRALADA